ncbi:hypothetical protein K449DRAFT_422658 [Hypoxylon sp. EC38]|nr:hypothetical protein K449DRAFT_422658 [Hypoxylon sp. EC38]
MDAGRVKNKEARPADLDSLAEMMDLANKNLAENWPSFEKGVQLMWNQAFQRRLSNKKLPAIDEPHDHRQMRLSRGLIPVRVFGSDCLRQSVCHCIGIDDDDHNDDIIGGLWGFRVREAWKRHVNHVSTRHEISKGNTRTRPPIPPIQSPDPDTEPSAEGGGPVQTAGYNLNDGLGLFVLLFLNIIPILASGYLYPNPMIPIVPPNVRDELASLDRHHEIACKSLQVPIGYAFK